MSRVVAIGMFDGVHRGHQALVRCVRRHALNSSQEATIVTFGSHPLQVVAPSKAPRLLTTLPQRVALLRQAGADQVITLEFDERLRRLSAREFMLMLRDAYQVDMIVLGFNHRFGHDRLLGHSAYHAAGQSVGVEVVRCDVTVELMDPDGEVLTVSSSQVRHDLSQGNLARANAMLGRNYCLSGTICHGQGIGHTIGYPTANVALEHPEQLVPANGVYACMARLGDAVYPAMTNIGLRPTVDGAAAASTIEANLIGFDGDIYGRQVELEFVARLRDERKFDSIEALRQQLDQDRAATLAQITPLNK